MLILIIFFLFPPPAWSYLDPGTGSYFFQIFIASFLGVLLTVKRYWKKITGFFASPGFNTEEIHAFEAHGLTEGKSALEEDEVLETRIVSLQETARLIKRRQIRDAKSLVPLFYVLTQRGLL